MSGAPVRVGPYVLEGQLGAGSMGAVWRGRHTQLGAHHAVKLIRPELARQADRERFKREVELLARVSHPGLVRIHASDMERGLLWYSMDLVEGQDLERMLREGPFEPRLAARLVRDVARAVQALHAAGVIHRDLKPANVVVDAQGIVRLVDMGLARAFGDEQRRLTLTSEVVGTPYYMAPEQARGGGIGPFTDVWGLGMILYALLAGRPGVKGAATAEVLEQVRAARVVPLEKQAPPGTPRALCEIVKKALDPDPVRRYPTAQALAEALDGWLRGGAAAARGRRVALPVALAALVVGGSGALALGIVLLRSAPGPAAPGDATASGGAANGAGWRPAEAGPAAQARERLAELAARLAIPGPPEASGLEDLAGLRLALGEARRALPADGPPEPAQELVLLEGRLLIAQGELAVRREEAAPARRCLEELQALEDPRGGRALRELKREGAAGLRGGLFLLDPRPDEDAMTLLGDLAALAQASPERADLRAWRIGLALRAGRPQDAVAAVEDAPDASQLAPDLRAEVWIAAGKLEQAEQLAPLLSPAVRGRLRWRLAIRATEAGRADEALKLVGAALTQAPEDPLRAEALAAAKQMLGRAIRWTREDPPEQLAASLRAEVAASRAIARLEPGWRVPEGRVVDVCQALLSAGPVLRRETVDLLAGLLEVSRELPDLYRLHAAAAVDWHLPDAERDLALIRRGIERFQGAEKDPETVAFLQEHLAMALDDRRDLEGLLGLLRQLPPEAPVRLRRAVLGRTGNQLRQAGRLEEAQRHLDEAWNLEQSHELLLFRHLWQRAMWERTRLPDFKKTALETAWKWLDGWNVEERSVWAPWLGEVCGFVCQEEELAGRQGAALEALDLLLRARDDEPRWAAHRLVIVARAEPLAIEVLRAGLPAVASAIDAAGDELAELAELETKDEGRNRRLREAAAGYHGLVNLRHLEEALGVENALRLREGLARLEERLIALESRRAALR